MNDFLLLTAQIPTLVDHNNNNFPIWESNAIILYLASRYDPDNAHGFLGNSAEDKAQVMQWLFFQASGQGMSPILVYFHRIQVLNTVPIVRQALTTAKVMSATHI
jgi:glutathione S-transferase